jgi:hypothetical protein
MLHEARETEREKKMQKFKFKFPPCFAEQIESVENNSFSISPASEREREGKESSDVLCRHVIEI